MICQRDSCTARVISAHVEIAKKWKQPRCPSTDKRIKKMWHVYNGVLPIHTKGEHLVICDNMDGTGVALCQMT